MALLTLAFQSNSHVCKPGSAFRDGGVLRALSQAAREGRQEGEKEKGQAESAGERGGGWLVITFICVANVASVVDMVVVAPGCLQNSAHSLLRSIRVVLQLSLAVGASCSLDCRVVEVTLRTVFVVGNRVISLIRVVANTGVAIDGSCVRERHHHHHRHQQEGQNSLHFADLFLLFLFDGPPTDHRIPIES